MPSFLGYQPLSLYVHCEGEGNETVVMENGLGGLYGMMWSFIPRLLVKKSFRVCAYDRRGYGWSETFEHGDPLKAIRYVSIFSLSEQLTLLISIDGGKGGATLLAREPQHVL